MAANRDSSHLLDPEKIINQAKQAIAPRSDAVKPNGTVAMLEIFIKQREEYHVQLRQNIIAICTDILNDPKNFDRVAFRKEDHEYMKKKDAELKAWLEAEPDMSKGDIYAVTPEMLDAEESDDEDFLFARDSGTIKSDPRVARILDRHELQARVTIERYRTELKRMRNWNRAMKKADSNSRTRTLNGAVEPNESSVAPSVPEDATDLNKKNNEPVERIRYKEGARIINKEADAAWGDCKQVIGRPKRQVLNWW